jgi:hypothetical protein
LSLSVAPLRPILRHRLPWLVITFRDGTASGWPLRCLRADELAEASADHGHVGAGLVLVIPGLSPSKQGFAVIGPGEMRLAQDLPEHCADRLRVGGSQLGTDLNRDRLVAALADQGVQPVRQIPVNDTWSALRFRPANK